MNNRSEQIFVGVTVALIGAVGGAVATAIINQLLAGKITVMYWWIWVIGAILGGLLLYEIYESNRFPFKKFRVTTNRDDGKSLLENSSKGRSVEDGAWLFSNSTVFGPWIRIPLRKGKYRAIFRIKVDNIHGENQHIVKLDVVSNSNFRGDKTLAARVFTNADFSKAGQYHFFPLDFYVLEHERDVELRVHSEGDNHHNTTLDYVKLSRRLF